MPGVIEKEVILSTVRMVPKAEADRKVKLHGSAFKRHSLILQGAFFYFN